MDSRTCRFGASSWVVWLNLSLLHETVRGRLHLAPAAMAVVLIVTTCLIKMKVFSLPAGSTSVVCRQRVILTKMYTNPTDGFKWLEILFWFNAFLMRFVVRAWAFVLPFLVGQKMWSLMRIIVCLVVLPALLLPYCSPHRKHKQAVLKGWHFSMCVYDHWMSHKSFLLVHVYCFNLTVITLSLTVPSLLLGRGKSSIIMMNDSQWQRLAAGDFKLGRRSAEVSMLMVRGIEWRCNLSVEGMCQQNEEWTPLKTSIFQPKLEFWITTFTFTEQKRERERGNWELGERACHEPFNYWSDNKVGTLT